MQDHGGPNISGPPLIITGGSRHPRPPLFLRPYVLVILIVGLSLGLSQEF